MEDPQDGGAPEQLRPARRVRFEVTGYLVGIAAGWYDLRTNAGRSQGFSIPEGCVDEESIAELAPEPMTAQDWEEIGGHLGFRLGPERGADLLTLFRSLAEARLPYPVPPGGAGRLLAQQMHAALRTACTRTNAPMGLSPTEIKEIVTTVLILVGADGGDGAS